MSLTRITLSRVPAPLRPLLVKHRELVKFAFTGGVCFVLTAGVNYGLKLTVMKTKPVSALTIAIIVATIASYLMNSGWSFRARGGRSRHVEAMLFFGVSALGVAVNDIPLYLARYAFDLQYPNVSHVTQELSDFLSGMIIGTLLGMAFRWWAMKKWVFPHEKASGTVTAASAGRLATPADEESELVA
ncbi:GtrA family protein [Actinoallomurus sp. NPDC050550]|uniref:GtrA family protein n=1 Tax=Actinoallomurus sp. NPDC050550 TaxID=3154937 RepID=UPI0033F6761F